MLPLQYLSGWRLHGIYFDRKNILNWEIIWNKFKVIWLLKVLYSTLAGFQPQLQRQFTYKSWQGALGPDTPFLSLQCHLKSGAKLYVCSVNHTDLVLWFKAILAIWYHMLVCFSLIDLCFIIKTKLLV